MSITLTPTKYVRFCESLIGIGGLVLESLDVPKTFDELYAESNEWICKPNMTMLMFAIDLLYSINKIELIEHRIGRIYEINKI